MNPDIFSFIESQENEFETQKVQVGDNWHWNFREHCQLIFHLKNGIFYTGENDWLRAFKNIMEPILNLAYWTEDLEVKDVIFYIENKSGRVLSFLVKKYHDEVYVKEHDLDTMFDEITESDIDFGGVLIQKGKERPEVLPLNSIAFCDQTDMMGGPIGIKFFFTPDKLRSMSKMGWGEKSNGATITLDELCILATFEKEAVGTLSKNENKVPGKTIEIYVVRGTMPEHYLKDNDNVEDYYDQLQIVAFYTDKDSNKRGVILYRKKEEKSGIKFFSSQPIYGRALGRGEAEKLLHPQIWTNFLTIHKMNMLEAASKVPLYTDDMNYTQRNKIQDMENLEITTIENGKKIYQVPTAAPANVQMIQNAVNEFYELAQLGGSANDPILGKEALSGTTFRGQERLVAQGRGAHDRRRGKRAKFIEEVYRWDIIPRIVKKIIGGSKFLATLTTEEMTWVSDELAISITNRRLSDMIFYEGKMPTKEEQDMMTQLTKQTFLKKGNKHLLEILKDELKDVELRMGINVAGKLKNLAALSDKILSIFQFIIANPVGFQQAMQVPALASTFSDILEFGGLSMADFSTLLQSPAVAQSMNQSMNQEQVPQLALANENG